MDTPFGPFITADDVCVAVETTILAELQPYLDAVLAGGGPELFVPNVVEQVPSVEALKAAAMPALGVFSPGLDGEPEPDETGLYRATWGVSAVIYDRSGDYRTTQQACRIYTAIIRTLLLQHSDLGIDASDLLWVGEDYNLIDASDARTLAGGRVDVAVTVEAVATVIPPLTFPPGVVTAVEADVDQPIPA